MIDVLYSQIISKTCRIKNAAERNDFITLVQEAYITSNVRRLKQYYRIVNNLSPCVETPEVSGRQPPKRQLGPNEEASGMPNPRVYNYYSNFNSPKNGVSTPKPPSYPLYANFGAYNK